MIKPLFKTLKLIVIIICTAAVLSVPAYFIYRNVEDIIVNELAKNAINLAATISEFAELNFDSYQNIPISSFESFNAEIGHQPDAAGLPSQGTGLSDSTAFFQDNTQDSSENEPNGPEKPFQDKLTAVFADLMAATGAQAIYIEKRLSEENKAYLINEDDPNKSRYAGNRMTEAELLAFNNGITVMSSVLNDEAVGEYIAGYAPIKSPLSDSVVGIVVVEYSLNHFHKITDSLRNIVTFSFSIIILLTGIVFYLLLKSRQKYYEKDYLTELCNKSYFEKRLKTIVHLSKDIHKPLSLIMLDIDHFKKINDTYGHVAGDKILKSVSETILAQTRDSDVCARYGGDEYVVLLSNSNMAQAAAVAERIRQKTALFDHLVDYPVDHARHLVTLSIGVAQLEGHMTPESFLEAADEAMYASKNTGKNKVTIYRPEKAPQTILCP